eukprot:3220491-Pyramimonas_sp.AAC.1
MEGLPDESRAEPIEGGNTVPPPSAQANRSPPAATTDPLQVAAERSVRDVLDRSAQTHRAHPPSSSFNSPDCAAIGC